MRSTSASLKGLSLISCCNVSKNGFIELITRYPVLEDLSLELCPNIFGREVLEATGVACTQLRHFSLHQVDTDYWSSFISSTTPLEMRSESLQCVSCKASASSTETTNDQLAAILNNCPHLEILCLRNCYHLIRCDALQAFARIKSVTID